MASIHVIIPDELDERLRRFLIRRHGVHLHGKITEIVRKALEEYLDREEGVDQEEEL